MTRARTDRMTEQRTEQKSGFSFPQTVTHVRYKRLRISGWDNLSPGSSTTQGLVRASFASSSAFHRRCLIEDERPQAFHADASRCGRYIVRCGTSGRDDAEPRRTCDVARDRCNDGAQHVLPWHDGWMDGGHVGQHTARDTRVPHSTVQRHARIQSDGRLSPSAAL